MTKERKKKKGHKKTVYLLSDRNEDGKTEQLKTVLCLLFLTHVSLSLSFYLMLSC